MSIKTYIFISSYEYIGMKKRLFTTSYLYFTVKRRLLASKDVVRNLPTAVGNYPRGWFSAKMAIRSSSKAYWWSWMNDVQARKPSCELPVVTSDMALTP